MKKLFIGLLLTIFYVSLYAESTKIHIPYFLSFKPVSFNKPLFSEDENINNQRYNIKKAMKFIFKYNKNLKPEKNDKIQFFSKYNRKWNLISPQHNKFIIHGNKNENQFSYLVIYFKTNKFSNPTLNINTNNMFTAYIDNNEILSKNNETNDTILSTHSKQINLETGYHKIFIKTLKSEKFNKDWTFQIFFESSDSLLEIDFFNKPTETYSLDKIIGNTKISSLSLSPDGSKVAVFFNYIDLNKDKTEKYLKIFDTKTKKVIFNSQAFGSISSFSWYPDSKQFSFIKRNDNGSMILLYNLQTQSIDTVLYPVKDLGGYYWSYDGKSLIYTKNEKLKQKDKNFKKYDGMQSRWPWWKNRSFLYLLTYPDKSTIRLTYGKISTNFNCFSHKGDKIIFTRSFVDFNNRPYSKKRYYLFDLTNFTVDTLFTSYWANGVIFSPDDQSLLVTGGPSSFGDIGINLPDSLFPNDYDNQAFIYNLKTKKVDPITYNFNPSIKGVYWNKANTIYFLTEDRIYSNIYKYNLKTKKFNLIKTPVDIVNSLTIDKNNKVGFYIGNGAYDYPKVYTINLKNNKNQLFKDFENPTYKYVKKGKVENWNFINKDGIKIEGFVYYPPDFDSTKKYPCIVYYYGGTSPVGKDFGGRYPKEYYAANGYIVYVLEPRGATGYGQQFSAYHVNDWGTRSAEDVIEGTKKFLKAHSFVDPDRIGCIGASFGGFLTMNILTKTDIFGAAISHAGISSISSYWGEGYWGYLYSAVATANSFPWNRKDIYVDKSPLFNADKVKTPLLLLQGSSDTNVPVGESIQMYTALKLLGKDVEMIHVKDEDHWILDYQKRLKWTKTIIAWFDKYLKNQPLWWNTLYNK